MTTCGCGVQAARDSYFLAQPPPMVPMRGVMQITNIYADLADNLLKSARVPFPVLTNMGRPM
jgi:hypothetical protein